MAISIRASLVVFGLLLAPMEASAQQTVALTTLPPPAPLVETPMASPGPGFAWVPGFWNSNGSQHGWSPGHWERPPQPAQPSESPRRDREGGRFRFRPWRWAGQRMQVPRPTPVQMPSRPQMPTHPQLSPQPHTPPQIPPPVVLAPMAHPSPHLQVMAVPSAPPRPRFERRPGMAPPGQVWIPGHWAWNTRQYVWNPGHFEAPPQPHVHWVAPLVMHRGRNWQMTPGHWH